MKEFINSDNSRKLALKISDFIIAEIEPTPLGLAEAASALEVVKLSLLEQLKNEGFELNLKVVL